MKILYVTTISETMRFFPEHIKMLQRDGHTVELACNCIEPYHDKVRNLQCKTYHIPFSRSIYSRDNLKALKEIEKLVEKGMYDVVHTHTPNASAIVRFACRRLRKKGLKIFYTAHGFHFYKGAPIKNWLLFFPVEWLCSHWTDVLITINHEDYAFAKRHMKAQRVEYVPGIGIDLKKFQGAAVNRKAKREELGIAQDDILVFSVGELNHNKNHEVIIRSVAELKDKRVHYAIAGQGVLYDDLRDLAEKLNIQEQIHLLGYQNEIVQLYQCVDLYILPSIREGLNVSLMEAMASGLPVVCSKIRGNTDLIADGKGGFLCRPDNQEDFERAIRKIYKDKELLSKMGEFNRIRIEKFAQSNVIKKMRQIYRSV